MNSLHTIWSNFKPTSESHSFATPVYVRWMGFDLIQSTDHTPSECRYSLKNGDFYVFCQYVMNDFARSMIESCSKINGDAFFLCCSSFTTFTCAICRGVPHELFLTKVVSQQISAGLEILRKFFLAWRFLQFEEHLFW